MTDKQPIYAELPDWDSGDEPIWNAIFKWEKSTPGEDASKQGDAVERAIENSMRAFADATHALRTQARPVVDEREAFESSFTAIAKELGDPSDDCEFEKASDGGYCNGFMQIAWLVWQARAALAAQAPQQEVQIRRKCPDELAEPVYIRTLCKALDAALDFAGTVAGGSSWWQDVWAELDVELETTRENYWQAQPAPSGDAWKDGDTAALVNKLRDVALQYRDTQQLRERIAHIVRPLVGHVQNQPKNEHIAGDVSKSGQESNMSDAEDTALLDWLDQNIFHREMNEWDAKYGGRGEQNMWVLFAPKGVQGSARNIINAARKEGK